MQKVKGEAAMAESKNSQHDSSGHVPGPDAKPASSEKAATAEDMGGDTPLMPVPTFSTFVLSLASSALVHLGEVPDPSTNKQAEDIALAKHSIDILTLLQDKITNGLDKDEARLLDGLLYELRMKYVVKK